MPQSLPFRVAVASLTLLLGVAALVALWIGPYLRDDRVLDRVVRAVALDWRDFGLDRAKTRLQFELDRQRVGLQVGDGDCTFVEASNGVKEVRCAWRTEVRVPLMARTLPMHFTSQARIEPDGDLTW